MWGTITFNLTGFQLSLDLFLGPYSFPKSVKGNFHDRQKMFLIVNSLLAICSAQWETKLNQISFQLSLWCTFGVLDYPLISLIISLANFLLFVVNLGMLNYTLLRAQNVLVINTRRRSFVNLSMLRLQQEGNEKPKTKNTLELWDQSSELRLEIPLRWCLITWPVGTTRCTLMEYFTSKNTHFTHQIYKKFLEENTRNEREN